MNWETIIIVVCFILYIVIRSIIANKEKETKEIKEKYQIQEGEISYTDLDKPVKPLFSNKIKLVGKPDYIVKQGDVNIPVEIKKGDPKSPFQNHIMQLIAYCYLVEETYGTKVPYGILVYDNYQTKILYTEKEKKEILNVMNIMRNQKEFKRNHEQITKCNFCGFNYICDERIK